MTRLILSLSILMLTSACGDDGSSAVDASPVADAPRPDGGCAAAAPSESTVDVGDVSLHVVEQGCGSAMVLLHGFPEFSFTWEPVQAALAAEHRVIIPDQRGYAPSDIPVDVTAYEVAPLVADVAALIEATGAAPAVVVAHDWGGAIGWVLAHDRPDLVARLIIINAPHPDVFARELADNPDQRSASSYMNLFIDPAAEAFLSNNDYQPLIDGFEGVLTPAEEDRYRAAWAQPGTLTGGLNWYRANIVSGPAPGPSMPAGVTVDVPTLVLWGTQDQFLLAGNLVGLDAYVPDLTIQEIDTAGHWVVYQEPDVVASAVLSFASAP